MNTLSANQRRDENNPTTSQKTNPPDEAGFAEVLARELDLLTKLRTEKGKSRPAVGPQSGPESIYERAHGARPAGLALSGGGIRSATFNLGVLLGLTKYGLLNRFDYLSTVSGGSYIGGWLSALLRRKAVPDERDPVAQKDVKKFEPDLTTHPKNPGYHADQKADNDNSGFPPVEHAAVRYLRRYTHYLIPRYGLSGDFLATVSLFLRNLLLLQIALVSALAIVFLSAHVVGLLSGSNSISLAFFFGVAAFSLFLALLSASLLLAQSLTQNKGPRNASFLVAFTVVLPSVVTAWFLSVGMVRSPEFLALARFDSARDLFIWLSDLFGRSIGDKTLEGLILIIAGMAAYSFAWFLGWIIGKINEWAKGSASAQGAGEQSKLGWRAMWVLISPIGAGGVLGLFLHLAGRWVADRADHISIWHGVTFGTPLLLLVFSATVAIHIGLAGSAFSEHDREWWARLGGIVLMASLAWLVVFGMVMYAAPLMIWLSSGGLVAVAGWAAGSGAGVLLASGSETGKPGSSSNYKEAIAKAAPWLFILGLGVLVAYGVHLCLLKAIESPEGRPLAFQTGFCALAAHELARISGLGSELKSILATLAAAAVFFLFFCWRFDINLFSLHTIYRNRLDRAFLGASRSSERKPNPFTGFDREDDLPFHSLDRQRPIHIINTTVNMTGGDDLAWQTRRGASFAFTPQWAGFEARTSQGNYIGRYRPTESYADGLSLATLMAVSGAAASPNMGYHTAPAVAALLTAFNLRLGRWCGNPRNGKKWKLRRPLSPAPIFNELTGTASANAGWVNLTDGGHFENLGIYELVRRRCHLILASDASCDPDHALEDLANAIRKCWTDFGVHIHFKDLSPLRREKDSRYCKVRYAVGCIHYKESSSAGNAKDEKGLVIYIKSSLKGNEPLDIREYADNNEAFPHESTSDQFYDEEQFEAYRHLGFEIAQEVSQLLMSKWEEGKPAPGYNRWLNLAE